MNNRGQTGDGIGNADSSFAFVAVLAAGTGTFDAFNFKLILVRHILLVAQSMYLNKYIAHGWMYLFKYIDCIGLSVR